MSSPPSRDDPWLFRSGWFQRPVQGVDDSGRGRSPVGRGSARAGSYLDVDRAASGAHHRRNRAGVVVRRGAWVDAFVVPRGRRHRHRGGRPLACGHPPRSRSRTATAQGQCGTEGDRLGVLDGPRINRDRACSPRVDAQAHADRCGSGHRLLQEAGELGGDGFGCEDGRHVADALKLTQARVLEL